MQHNFYAAVKPFIIFLTCIGVVPFCFKNNKLCISHIHSVYVMLLIASDLGFYYFYYDTVASQLKLQKTPKISEQIQMTAAAIHVIAILTTSIMGKKKYVQFSKTILKCEYKFKEIMHIPHNLLKRQIYICAIPWIFVIVLICIAQKQLIETFSNTNHIANNIIFGYIWILNGCVSIFAILHILTIRRAFGILNECLKRMQTNNTWRELKYEQHLKFKIWKANIENLAIIGSLHLELCECIREFNNAFEVILIAKCFKSFVTILMATYFGYITYQQSRYVYAICCTWIAFSYTVSLTILCYSCKSTINEVKMCFNFISFDVLCYD